MRQSFLTPHLNEIFLKNLSMIMNMLHGELTSILLFSMMCRLKKFGESTSMSPDIPSNPEDQERLAIIEQL